MSAIDDNELIEATLRGNVDSFGILVERYQRPLYNAALRITGNREDALEATQSAFLGIFDKLETFDPSYRFFSWIFRAVVNEALDIARNRSRFVDDETAAPVQLADGNPETELSSNEESTRVRRALQQLDLDYRVVVILRHFHDLSYAEMAEVIGIPEKTVKSRLFSARRELRELLSRTDDGCAGS
jgi:RNA polymerase sigma-70 factor (ECF subfamily)